VNSPSAARKVVRVSVSSSVLRWALERSGKRLEAKKKFPKLEQWLAGEIKPTFNQLREFARITSVPFGYLFLSEPPKESLKIPFFRTMKEHKNLTPSPELIQTLKMMEYRQSWLRDFLIDEGHDPLPFVGSVHERNDPAEVAEKIRNVLKLEDNWAEKQVSWTAAFRKLQEKAEDAGILVIINSIVGNNTHRKLNPEEFRGFVLTDEYAPLIFINGADSKAAQMFTFAHELAHIWLGRDAIFDLRELQPAEEEIEQICNRIAAEFLVPAQKLEEFWPSVKDNPDRFEIIARKFKVSQIVAARRALDLGMITKEEFLEFYHHYREKWEERKKSIRPQSGDFYTLQLMRIGRRFAETVVRAVRSEKILYREAYDLTGLYGETFEKFARRISTGG